MNTHKLPDGSLVIEERWPLLKASCVIGGALLPAIMFLANSGGGPINWEKIAGAALGGMLLILIAAIVDNRRFVFDPALKVLVWEQRNWFRSRGGRMPFSEVRDVLVTTSPETHGDSNRRHNHYSAVLVTASGQVRLTATSGTAKHEYDKLAEAILDLLAKPDATPDSKDEISRLIAGGRIVEAISLARAQRGLSLAEAKALVAEIKERQQSTS